MIAGVSGGSALSYSPCLLCASLCVTSCRDEPICRVDGRRWEWSPGRVPSELGDGPAAALVQRLARVGALDHAVRAAQVLPSKADLYGAEVC